MNGALNNTEKCSMDLLNSRTKPEFCDIKIKTNDGEIEASKFILSVRSEYFSVMFSKNFLETFSGQVNMPYPKEVVEKMLIYLYSGEMVFKDLKLELLLDLLDLLRMMNLSEEFKQVESYVVDNINQNHFSLSECVKNLDKSYNVRMEAVWAALMDYIRMNLSQIEDVGVLSETMIIALLKEEDDGDDEEEERSDDEYDKMIHDLHGHEEDCKSAQERILRRKRPDNNTH